MTEEDKTEGSEPEKYEFNPDFNDNQVQPEKPRKGRNKLVYAGVFIVIFAAAFALFSFTPITGYFLAPVAKGGDVVRVDYIGMADGVVFDTTYADVGKGANITRFAYEPLEFKLGAGQVIPGFEEGILGMRIGDKKTVTIPPEEGYGQPDLALMQEIPRIQELNRTETIPLKVEVPLDFFVQTFGLHTTGDVVVQEETGLEYEVTGSDNESVSLLLLVEEGKDYRLASSPWTGTILEVDGDEATIMYNPEEEEVDTGYGTATVTTTEDKIIIIHNPAIGSSVSTPLGNARITGVNEQNITLDLNHFLAGKTLIFEIELVGIGASPAQARPQA